VSITPAEGNGLFLATSQPAKNQLKENEAIINPYYMQQLLEYGIRLSGENGLDAQSLLKDAEVTKMRLNQAVLYLILFF
jgi:hypothetical protein